MKETAIVHIKKGEARSLKAGGMWIYDNEIARIEGEFENGDMVKVDVYKRQVYFLLSVNGF